MNQYWACWRSLWPSGWAYALYAGAIALIFGAGGVAQFSRMGLHVSTIVFCLLSMNYIGITAAIVVNRRAAREKSSFYTDWVG